MSNRFVEIDRYQPRVPSGPSRRLARAQSGWARTFTAQDRVLVILIENGGTDLGVPALVDKLLSAVPDTLIPDTLRRQLIDYLTTTITKVTDNLIETAELAANRYTAAKPALFGDVIVLRDGTSSYEDLKRTLVGLSRDGKIIDVFVLTHGREDTISANGDINGQMIVAMKTELGKPLSIRSVYMMNCVGSSLNQAWLSAGAKVSAGSLVNNYLPEPTMFFFWSNWKDGQTFETAVTSAYRKTINLMNGAVRGFVNALPIPGTSLLADYLDFEKLDFVKVSFPVVLGQRTLTVSSDDLTFTQSTQGMASSLATTVLPISLLRSLARSLPAADAVPPRASVSPQGLELIARWEPSGTAPEAIAQLANEAQSSIQNAVKVALTQNQHDALVSFVVSIGGAAFERSTLLKVLNRGDQPAAVGELKKWVKAKHDGVLVDVPDMVRRRSAEADLFEKKNGAMAESLSRAITHSYRFHSPSRFASAQSIYSRAQSPIAIAGVAISADAAQVGLGAVAVLQTQFNALPQGSFSLAFDKVQRLLTNEARTQMPGAREAKNKFSRHLMSLGVGTRPFAANAEILIEWEGNAYGEIGTVMMRRDLSASSEWTRSSASIAISRIEFIPPADEQIDPRTVPIRYGFEGNYDPWGNGHFEFSGEFEVNAFGGLKFNRHQVVSRAALDFAIAGLPEEYVQKYPDIEVPVPTIPEDQMAYLRTKLP